jgi:hypothetical protein
MSLDQGKIAGEHTESRANDARIRAFLLARIQRAEAFCDRHGPFLFFLAVAIFSVFALYQSSRKPLWFDELLGLSAASAPRLRDIFAALARPVDINPPLYHLIDRLCLDLFGRSAFAARLPAFAGMLVFFWSLYTFISRRLSRVWGVLAVLVAICMPVSAYAWEGRPYGLLLGITGVAMVSWQRWIGNRDHKSLAIFTVACFFLPLTHYYAVLIPASFVLAALIHGALQKRMDMPLILAGALAPAVALFLVRGLIHPQRAILTNMHSKGSIASFAYGMTPLTVPPWAICLTLGLLTIGFWIGKDSSALTLKPVPGFRDAEWILAWILMFLPVTGAIATVATHVYIPRYFMACLAGFVILFCHVTAYIRSQCRGVAFLLICAMVAVFVFEDVGHAVEKRHQPPRLAWVPALVSQTGKPVIFMDAKDYLQAWDMFPASRGSLYYAAEPELADRLTGTDTDDKLMIALAETEPHHVIRLADMANISASWNVAAGEFGWLVGCLTNMDLDMRTGSPGAAFSVFRVDIPSLALGSPKWCAKPELPGGGQ